MSSRNSPLAKSTPGTSLAFVLPLTVRDKIPLPLKISQKSQSEARPGGQPSDRTAVEGVPGVPEVLIRATGRKLLSHVAKLAGALKPSQGAPQGLLPDL